MKQLSIELGGVLSRIEALEDAVNATKRFIVLTTAGSGQTYSDLLNKAITEQRLIPFSNWTDSTNFPTIYGNGIVIPGGDNSICIIYMTLNGNQYLGRKKNNTAIEWLKITVQST